jgi:hypothetical protein
VALKDEHPVDVVHRISAAALGILLAVFAAGGFASGPPLFSTRGPSVLGMVTNGALSVLSVVAALVLVGAAVLGGRPASTMATAMGVVFLLSGIAHLGLINTQFNVLAFRLSNVFFSLGAGMLLTFLGLYGRVSGGLPPDNPYRRANPRRARRPAPDEQLADERSERDEEQDAMLRAEIAMGEGKATEEQQRLVRRELAQRRGAERQRAYRNQNRGVPSPREADQDRATKKTGQ